MHQQYAAQQRMSDILFGFTLVAILISALGILAMATYFIRQRSMEIAVRKVFGSTNREVLQRLVLHFVRYVLAAFVIAVPVIWYLMHDWLSQYVLRIPLSWTIFALAGLTALPSQWRPSSAKAGGPPTAIRWMPSNGNICKQTILNP